MKRLICLIAMVAVMIGAAGLAGAEEKQTAQITFKDSWGLRGAVKRVAFESETFKTEMTFSENGLIQLRRIEDNERAEQSIMVWHYDKRERIYLFEEIDGKTFEILTSIHTIYDDENRTYRAEKIENKSEKILWIRIGELTEGLKVKKEIQFYLPKGSLAAKIAYGSHRFSYDSQGNLIKMDFGNRQGDRGYNAFGNQIWSKEYSRKRSEDEFQLQKEEATRYNEKMFKSEFHTISYKDGKFLNETKITYGNYEADHYDNWIARKVKKSDGKTWTETRKITYWE